MLRFNHLTVALAAAAVVLLGHPDTARAQSLTFSPSSVGLTISGPGGVAGPTSVSVSSGTAISSLFISGINTSDHTNWLCATASGNTVNVYAGTGNCGFTPTTTQLAHNQNYTGTISVQGNGGTLNGTINVTLSVGNSGGGGTARLWLFRVRFRSMRPLAARCPPNRSRCRSMAVLKR